MNDKQKSILFALLLIAASIIGLALLGIIINTPGFPIMIY